MKSEDVLSDLNFRGNRVVSFALETKLLSTKRHSANISFDFDYNIKDIQQNNNSSYGLIDYTVIVKATIKKKVLYKIKLIMEGAFSSETLDENTFKDMIEINGLITLSQISRAYIQSVTAQSGFKEPVRVPMINVMKLIEQKKQEDLNARE